MSRGWVWAVALCLLACTGAQCSTIHVRTDGSDSRSGASWAEAKKTVAAGIAAASSGDEVWVAGGTYLERANLKNGVALYGGFAGTETSRGQRSPAANETIIDGQRSGTVVRVPPGAGPATVIDGLTLQRGGYDYGSTGGGIYCASSSSPVISNNIVRWNSALGSCGIYCDGASPTITGNFITGNSAGYGDGGGVCCTPGSSPAITGNTFSGNGGVNGGAIACRSCSALISGNTFIGNSANYGGAIYCESSSPSISGNVFTENSAGYGGAVYCASSSSPTIGCLSDLRRLDWMGSESAGMISGGRRRIHL